MSEDILDRILAVKHQEVKAAVERISLGKIRELAERRVASYSTSGSSGGDSASSPRRPFASALQERVAKGKTAVIAEIKKASPSKGLLREHFVPSAIAKEYATAGACCLSVLTDEKFFQGHADYLREAREASARPCLRKDFIIDPYQVYQSLLMDADAILLIVKALPVALMKELAECAKGLGLSVLVEVHDSSELEKALQLDTPLIGVNNRNLRTFETRLETSLSLRPLIPKDRLLIAESGISTPEDVQRLRDGDIHAFLVGEAFMRQTHPGEALARLFPESL